MKREKKYFIIFFAFFVTILIFANTSFVNAENIENVTIEYNKEINAKMLEKIKKSRLNVMIEANEIILANPAKEDTSKYYYSQLKSDISRNAYNTFATEISNKVKIQLNSTQYNISDTSKNAIAECFEKNLLQYVIDGYEAYIMDSAQNYWWTTHVQVGDIDTTIINNNTVLFNTVEFSSQMSEWSDYKNFNTKFKELTNKITGNSTYEIVKSINNYIYNNITYQIIDDTDVEQTVYGALVLNKAVCEGQAQLFNLLCRAKGVTSINVYGYTNKNSMSTAHAWNYVYEPTKKQWYAVDVTWNNYYKDNVYIMIGSDTYINGIKFGQNHIAGFKQFVLQTYTPSTPVLSTEKYIDGISIDENYIVNIQPNTTYSNFKKEFTDDIKFSVISGTKEISDSDLIKTGQKFLVGNMTYTLVVIGDTTGDGKADIRDILQMNKHRLNKTSLSNEYYKAGDTNKDGKVDIRDILLLNKYRLNKITEI